MYNLVSKPRIEGLRAKNGTLRLEAVSVNSPISDFLIKLVSRSRPDGLFQWLSYPLSSRLGGYELKIGDMLFFFLYNPKQKRKPWSIPMMAFLEEEPGWYRPFLFAFDFKPDESFHKTKLPMITQEACEEIKKLIKEQQDIPLTKKDCLESKTIIPWLYPDILGPSTSNLSNPSLLVLGMLQEMKFPDSLYIEGTLWKTQWYPVLEKPWLLEHQVRLPRFSLYSSLTDKNPHQAWMKDIKPYEVCSILNTFASILYQENMMVLPESFIPRYQPQSKKSATSEWEHEGQSFKGALADKAVTSHAKMEILRAGALTKSLLEGRGIDFVISQTKF